VERDGSNLGEDFGKCPGRDAGRVAAASSSLMELTLRYMETMYEATREHADDHAYQLADPKAMALWRIQTGLILASNQYSPSVQIHARRVRKATVTAETKAIANNRAGAKSGGDGDGTGALTSSQSAALARDAAAQKRDAAERRRAGNQPGKNEAPNGGAPRKDGAGSRGT
jgi:hypothetical protein